MMVECFLLKIQHQEQKSIVSCTHIYCKENTYLIIKTFRPMQLYVSFFLLDLINMESR